MQLPSSSTSPGTAITPGRQQAGDALYKTAAGLHWLQFDGTDDAVLPDTLSMSPGAGTADWTTAYGMDSGTDTSYVLLGNDGDGSTFGIIAQDGSSSTALIATGGTLASIDVDGSGLTLSGLTRDDVHTALGGAHVLRAQYGVTAAKAWTTPVLGQYFTPGPFSFAGDFYGVLLIQRALTAGEKASMDTYLADKTGVTL